ncbi:hypothetical protein Taro_031558 [Colocasia esculenta]|uniref:DUF4283 domain-containing protein n=1 Tax=Colocasia esculenta TaxID=4460 RepID=A0A843W3H4_COLES|nr:hypothetical protein [Colocasia esculenta]
MDHLSVGKTPDRTRDSLSRPPVGYGSVLVFSVLDINSGLASRWLTRALFNPHSLLSTSPTFTLELLHEFRWFAGARGKAVVRVVAADQAGNVELERGVRGAFLGFRRDSRFFGSLIAFLSCGAKLPVRAIAHVMRMERIALEGLAGAVVSPAAMAVQDLSSVANTDPGRRSYAQIISSTKPPPSIPIGIKPPSFTDSGEPAVFFTREEVSKSIQTLKFALITRCPFGRCSIPDFKSLLSQRMLLKGEYIVSVLNNRHLLLRFEEEEDYLKVIMRRSLYLKGLLYRFFKWDPHFDFNADPTVIPIWIGLPMLPVNYYFEDFLKSIPGNLGRVLRIYEPTMALTQTKEAFVCIELDILKARPERIWIGCGSEGFWQNISYYGIPAICSFCHKLGHDVSTCHKKAKPSEGHVQEVIAVQMAQNNAPTPVPAKRSWRQKNPQEKPFQLSSGNRFSILQEGVHGIEGNQVLPKESPPKDDLFLPEDVVPVEGLHGDATLRGQLPTMEDIIQDEETGLHAQVSLREHPSIEVCDAPDPSTEACDAHIPVMEQELRPSSPGTVADTAVENLEGIDSSDLFPIPPDEQLHKASIIAARENAFMPTIEDMETTQAKRRTGVITRIVNDHNADIVLSSSDQQVTLSVIQEDQAHMLITFVYASCTVSSRRCLFDDLIAQSDNVSVPWIIGGDFNCISTPSEKSGGLFGNLQSMVDFNAFMHASSLVDAGFVGSPFTWVNNRTGQASIKARLDRFLMNSAFVNNYQGFNVKHLIRCTSDHSPLLASIVTDTRPPARFVFQAMWTYHDSFLDVIKLTWNEYTTWHPNPFTIFLMKLKAIKQALRVWNKNTFGNVEDNVKRLELEVALHQDTFDCLPSPENRAALNKVSANYKKALLCLDTFWAQKARMNWLENGDRNSANSRWIPGKGDKVDFIHDSWYGDQSIAETLLGPPPAGITLQAVVKDPYHPARSLVPPQVFLDLSLTQDEDKCIWKPSSSGEFTTKSTYDLRLSNNSVEMVPPLVVGPFVRDCEAERLFLCCVVRVGYWPDQPVVHSCVVTSFFLTRALPLAVVREFVTRGRASTSWCGVPYIESVSVCACVAFCRTCDYVVFFPGVELGSVWMTGIELFHQSAQGVRSRFDLRGQVAGVKGAAPLAGVSGGSAPRS